MMDGNEIIMYKYYAYGLNIHSEIFLPELICKESSVPDIIITLGNVDPFKDVALNKGLYFRETKNAKYRFWDDIGKFKISNGNSIVVDPAKSVDDKLLRMFVLGTIFANLLNQRGLLVLHASAVNINNSVFAFLGSKNKGKSTLALKFYENGYPIVADDYIPIQFENRIPFVYTGFPQLKLSRKSLAHSNFNLEKNLEYTSDFDKFYFPTKRYFTQNKLPLKRIYILERGEKNAISPLKLQKAFIELTKNNFGITKYNNIDLKRSFKQCNNLIKNVVIHKLTTGDLENLHEIVNLVKDDTFNQN
jgi:hypothetical protein